MKVEGPRFSFRVAPDISAEEWAEMAHVVCKIIRMWPAATASASPRRRREAGHGPIPGLAVAACQGA
jgi:hypothetical protein